MDSPNIRLVVFDLGGVMVRICRQWSEVLGRIGIPVTRKLIDSFAGDALIEPSRQYERGRIDQNELARLIAELTGLEPEQAMAAIAAWIIEPYPGVQEMVSRLAQAPVATACLTNTNHLHWNAFLNDGPHRLPVDRLDFRFASHLIGAVKPGPVIYQRVESDTGIEPAGIIFFDDTDENCCAARDRGWLAPKIDPMGDPMAQVDQHLKRCGVFG